jgi:hypothetical protein
MGLWRGKGDLIHINHDKFAHFCCYCPCSALYMNTNEHQHKPKGNYCCETEVVGCSFRLLFTYNSKIM